MMSASFFLAALPVVGVVALIVLIVGAVVAAVVFGVRHISANNRRLAEKVAPNSQREVAMRQISARCSDDSLCQAIEAVADQIKFADWAIVLPSDAEIDAQIAMLSQAIDREQSDAARSCIRQIEGSLKARRDEVAAARRGSF